MAFLLSSTALHLLISLSLDLSFCRPISAHIVGAPAPPPKSHPTRGSTTSRPAARLVEARAEVQSLTSHPGAWDPSKPSSSGARKKLRRRHLHLFFPEESSSGATSPTAAFDEFASAICEAGIGVARKEAFETWSAAALIDAHFGGYRDDDEGVNDVGRVADVAGGHGLLGWALLLLDDARRAEEAPPRTVFCVDRRMPPSAVAIQSSMLARFPSLSSRFHYVEGSLEQLVPHRTCLLASVHACAGLSDIIVDIAARSGAPVALVPCCHSRKKLELYASPYGREEYGSIIAAEGKVPNLADRLDAARAAALRNAGFDVSEEYLPEEFTAKNRLILGAPPEGGPIPLAEVEASSDPFTTSTAMELRPGRMPPVPAAAKAASTTVTAKELFLAKMAIPCEDARGPRAEVEALSGRAAAERRRRALHVRDHADCPRFDVSLWLPPPPAAEEDAAGSPGLLSEEGLSRLASGVDAAVRVSAAQLGSEFVNSAGRRARTFRLSYRSNAADDKSSSPETAAADDVGVTTDRAKAIHELVCGRIPKAFPGAVCR